jgi:hypothetical protein
MILAEYNGDSGEDALAKFDEYVDETLQDIIKAAREWHSAGNNQDELYNEFKDDYEGAAYHMIDKTRGSLNEAKKKKNKPEDVAPQEDVDIDLNIGDEQLPAEPAGEETPPMDAVAPEADTIGDIDPTVKSIQDSLQKAFAQAKTLGDEKLMNQIGNTITMLVRTQVLGQQNVAENVNEIEDFEDFGKQYKRLTLDDISYPFIGNKNLAILDKKYLDKHEFMSYRVGEGPKIGGINFKVVDIIEPYFYILEKE